MREIFWNISYDTYEKFSNDNLFLPVTEIPNENVTERILIYQSAIQPKRIDVDQLCRWGEKQ